MTNTSTSLHTALCLPQALIHALSTGQMVVSLSRGFLKGFYSQFSLCPVGTGAEEDAPNVIHTHLWARVEGCRIHKDPSAVDALAQLTIWSKDRLHQILQERPHFFLAYLRVYERPEPIEIGRDRLPPNPIDDFGTFINLPQPISVAITNPVLGDTVFKERHQQLIHLKPPKYPKLIQLQRQVESWQEEKEGEWVGLCTASIALNHDLKTILGWKSQVLNVLPQPNQHWIQDIATIGYSSDGHAFEKLVRQSLILLGFRNTLNNKKAALDPDATGGAGGLDICANEPFPLVGECKASAHGNVPNEVSHKLVSHGQTHLGIKLYQTAIKILFVPGKLTFHAEAGAIGNQMNVMRPETLQRLVQLKAKHPGSIDLMSLKPCLESSPYGEESDDKINTFIDQIIDQLKIRATLIEIVKTLEGTGANKISLNTISGAYLFQNGAEKSLNEAQIEELLIELSSPLAGYLGRQKGEDGSDRFYFLRNLIVE